jgi:hypothetical protein
MRRLTLTLLGIGLVAVAIAYGTTASAGCGLGEQLLKRDCGRAAPAATPRPPTADPTPVATGAPSSTGACVKIVTWRPPRSRPLSDARAAALVCPAPETVPANTIANAYRPSRTQLRAFRRGQTDRFGRTQLQYNRNTRYVTGGFSGTTDEILQWVAHKWGIPEDVVRAAASNESSWNMSQVGDQRSVRAPGRYPAYSRIAGTRDVYQSLGILQVKWTPEGLHQGTEPLRWESTAFNADYWASVVRYYFDGLCDWCGPRYTAGQRWNSIGAWFAPSPWARASARYQDHVRERLAAKDWPR